MFIRPTPFLSFPGLLDVSGTFGRHCITIDTLWEPSAVTVGTGIQATASDANGTLQIDLTGTESRSQLKLTDSQNVVRSLTPSVTGALAWNGSTLVDLTYLSNTYTTTSSINTSLATKQNTLTNYTETAGATSTIIQTVDDTPVLSTPNTLKCPK